MGATNVTEFDVAVAGASCAGLYAAQLLAQAGMRVAVFERKQQLGEPRRSLIVTDELVNILGFKPERAIVHQVDVMELFSRWQTARVHLQSPDLIVERGEMVQLLAERAVAAGVELHLGCSIERVWWNDDRMELEISSNGAAKSFNVHAQTLIAADGAHSLIARQLTGEQGSGGAGEHGSGGAEENAPLHPSTSAPQHPGTPAPLHRRHLCTADVPILQAHVRLPTNYDPRVVQVWFDRARTRFFYWLIPESDEFGVLGLVADSSSRARHLLDEFLAERGYTPLGYQGAVIPLHQPTRQIEWRRGSARVLLVGDAAAHVKVTTVGGLVLGLWGAKCAAQSIIKGTSYTAELGVLHRELYLHDFIRWILDRFDDGDYDRLLSALNDPLCRLLASRNRDSMAGAALALVTAQPSLLAMIAKAILLPYRQSPRRPIPASR